MSNETTQGQAHQPRGALTTTIILVAAFISGAAALIYQVSWVKMLTLTFGSTTGAAAAVIAAYMGAMGLGAWLYKRWERLFHSPAWAYAVLEAGIALTAVAVSSVMYDLPGLYAGVSRHFDNRVVTDALRFLLTFLLLGVPAALMGATFPALSRVAIREQPEVHRYVGLVYGVNTLGAAVGVILSGFILIEAFGNMHSVWLAACANLVAAALAAVLALRLRPDVLPAQAQHPAPSKSRDPQHTIRVVLVITLLVSGFATMAYEILWFRAAKYLLGNSTNAMSLVLFVFLTGLGVGAVVHPLLARRGRPIAHLAVIQMLIAALALLAMALESYLLTNATTWSAISVFARDVLLMPWESRLLLTAGAGAVILLPPTLMMGLVFPLASSQLVDSVSLLGRRLGSAYLFATIGSVVGVIAAAQLILPSLGALGGTKLVAGMNLSLGILLAVVAWKSRDQRSYFALSILPLAAALIFLLPQHLSFIGEFESLGGTRLLFEEEGDLATVKVAEMPQQGWKGMTIDGYLIGTNRAFRGPTAHKQLLLAHLPMALRPLSSRTLNIGLATGTTLASLASYPQVTSLDCVEISESVLRGSRLFEDSRVMDDPRTHVYIDDATHYLLRDTVRYDLIIADGKQNAQFPGNATLLSREFFAMMRDRLTERGMVVQWIPLAFPPSVFSIILRTFVGVFPYSAVYYFPPQNVLLVGALSPPDSTSSDTSRAWSGSRARDDLSPYHLSGPRELLAARVAEGSALVAVLGQGPINTWDRPLLEFMTYRAFRPGQVRRYFFDNVRLMMKASSPPLRNGGVPGPGTLQACRESARVMQTGFFELMRTQQAEAIRPFCTRALEINPQDSLAISLLSRIKNGYDALMDPGL